MPLGGYRGADTKNTLEYLKWLSNFEAIKVCTTLDEPNLYQKS